MVHEPLAGTQRKCTFCGADIPEVRLNLVPDVRTCVGCQRKLEKNAGDVHVDPREAGVSPKARPIRKPEAAPDDTVQVDGTRVVVGRWSGNLMDLVAQGDELQRLVQLGKKAEAQALVQVLPAEAQAALVTMGEDPEEMLSLTGADDSGRAVYSTQVVALLPSELLSGLISVDAQERKFNTELIRAMSPEAFQRTMAETLELVDSPTMRSRVSWEWLQALATLEDFGQRAELLRSVDPALLEEALLDRLEHLDLHAVISAGEFQIYRFQLFSEQGIAGALPSAFIEDPETGEVLDAVYEAAPDLLCDIVRVAWERAGGGSG